MPPSCAGGHGSADRRVPGSLEGGRAALGAGDGWEGVAAGVSQKKKEKKSRENYLEHFGTLKRKMNKEDT